MCDRKVLLSLRAEVIARVRKLLSLTARDQVNIAQPGSQVVNVGTISQAPEAPRE